MVLIETPANPTMIMTDIPAARPNLRTVIHRVPVVMCGQHIHGAGVFQQSASAGADLCLYSATSIFRKNFSDMLRRRSGSPGAQLFTRFGAAAAFSAIFCTG